MLVKSLGKGTFAEVYLAQRRGTNEFYAAKKVSKSLVSHPLVWKCLQSEIEVLRTLNHKNIMKYYETLQSSNEFYIITEYCNGGGLSDNLEQYKRIYGKPFTEEITQYFMRQILDAIAYMHSQKIMHRDLKMENILLNYKTNEDKANFNLMNAEIKIIDFGSVADLKKEKYVCTVLGSPISMAPSVLKRCLNRGDPYAPFDEKTDIWSLGIICYEMLVGHRPFEGLSVNEIFLKVENGTYIMPLTISQEAVLFINGMLQYDDKKRLTANQLLQHIFLIKNVSEFRPVDREKAAGLIRGNNLVVKTKDANSGTPTITIHVRPAYNNINTQRQALVYNKNYNTVQKVGIYPINSLNNISVNNRINFKKNAVLKRAPYSMTNIRQRDDNASSYSNYNAWLRNTPKMKNNNLSEISFQQIITEAPSQDYIRNFGSDLINYEQQPKVQLRSGISNKMITNRIGYFPKSSYKINRTFVLSDNTPHFVHPEKPLNIIYNLKKGQALLDHVPNYANPDKENNMISSQIGMNINKINNRSYYLKGNY